jgi:O-antigen/teichoic acid export membrane protein
MGWNIWGNLAATLFGTGLNLLLNVFFGPAVNAARAIAVQVETAIAHFSTNFLMAVNPQITKLYAQNNMEDMHKLIFRASKFTFFLLLTLTLPVMMETETILNLWLKIVPDHTVVFLRLLLCIAIVDATARPLMTAVAATGNVKLYQSIVGGILLSIVPVAYFVLKLGGTPESVYIVHFIICIVSFMARLLVVSPLINLSIYQYFMKVIARCLFVLLISLSLSALLKTLLPSGFLHFFIVCLSSSLIPLITTFILGLTPNEQRFVKTKAAKVLISAKEKLKIL